MTEGTRTARPWLTELESIQDQMRDVSEEQVLAALEASVLSETASGKTETVIGRMAETRGAARAFAFNFRLSSERDVRHGSALTPTS